MRKRKAEAKLKCTIRMVPNKQWKNQNHAHGQGKKKKISFYYQKTETQLENVQLDENRNPSTIRIKSTEVKKLRARK